MAKLPKPLKIDADDVRIDDLSPRDCEDCDDNVATKEVVFCLRNNGMEITIGNYCMSCADELADRLRASLPEGKPE